MMPHHSHVENRKRSCVSTMARKAAHPRPGCSLAPLSSIQNEMPLCMRSMAFAAMHILAVFTCYRWLHVIETLNTMPPATVVLHSGCRKHLRFERRVWVSTSLPGGQCPEISLAYSEIRSRWGRGTLGRQKAFHAGSCKRVPPNIS